MFVVELFVWFYYLAISLSLITISPTLFVSEFFHFSPLLYYHNYFRLLFLLSFDLKEKEKTTSKQTKKSFSPILFPVFVCGLSSFFDDVSLFLFIYNHLRHTHTHTVLRMPSLKFKKKYVVDTHMSTSLQKHVQLYYIYPSFGCSVERFSFWRCTPSDPRWQSGYNLFPPHQTKKRDSTILTWFFESFPITITLCQSVEVSFWLSEQSTWHQTISFFFQIKIHIGTGASSQTLLCFIYLFFIKAIVVFLYPIMFHFHSIFILHFALPILQLPMSLSLSSLSLDCTAFVCRFCFRFGYFFIAWRACHFVPFSVNRMLSSKFTVELS